MTGDAQAAAAGQPSPAAARPSRRSIATRALLLIAIVLLVFVGILPRVVDYDAVRAALSSLSTTQLAVLIVATAIAYVANAVPSRILIPALSWPHAVGADLAARAVVSTIPGPTDVATRFVLYRQWAIPDDMATAGIVFAAFFETASALVLPLIATLGVVVTGSTTQPAVIWLSIIGVAVLAAGVLWSDPTFNARSLSWIGFVTEKPRTEDYVPLAPWAGVVALGVAAGDSLARNGFRALLPIGRAPPWLRWMGRHSLLIYMIHQPLLLGGLWLVVRH